MANFAYKKTTTTAMKIAGIIDTDEMTIDVDGITKKLSTLLSDFNGAGIEINVKVKDEEELGEPTETSDEEYSPIYGVLAQLVQHWFAKSAFS